MESITTDLFNLNEGENKDRRCLSKKYSECVQSIPNRYSRPTGCLGAPRQEFEEVFNVEIRVVLRRLADGPDPL